MRILRLRVSVVSSALAVLAAAWAKLQFIFDAFQLRANTGSVWKALMDAPKLVPWLLVAFFVVAFVWSLRPSKQPVVEPPSGTEHDRLVRQERARLEAAEQHRRERAARRLTGSIGDQLPDVLEEMEADRKAEAEARRQRLIQGAEAERLRAAVKAKAQLMHDRLGTRRHSYGNCRAGVSDHEDSYLAALWDAEERGHFYDEYHRSTFMPQGKTAPEDLPGDTIAELQRNVIKHQARRREANRTYKHRRDLIEKGRDVVHRWRTSDRSEPFEIFASKDRGYLDIQPHLGHEYQAGRSRAAERIIYGPEHDENRVAALLQELARLAKEWNLE